jgi:hypothetical protein
VIFRQEQQIGDSPLARIIAHRFRRENQASNDACRLKEIQPVLTQPVEETHCP